MKVNNVKIGDKVRIHKDIPEKELTKLLNKCNITSYNVLELQSRGEVIVEGIQKAVPKSEEWDSITLEGSGLFWPIELFEPVVNKTSNTKKSKEGQVQEDIQKIKDIVKRYGLTEQGGPAMPLIKWLEDFGQDNLAEAK